MDDGLEENRLYTNPCANPRCKASVVMRPGVSAGWYVGVCNQCHMKQVEKEQKSREINEIK